MNEDPALIAIVIAIAVIWLACVVVCFLKGKPWSAILGIVAVLADAFGPPTINGLYLFNPLITIVSALTSLLLVLGQLVLLQELAQIYASGAQIR